MSIIEDVLEFTDCRVVAVENTNKNGVQMKTIKVEYSGEQPTVCPHCGEKMYSHGTRTLLVTDTPLLGKPTNISLVFPRKRCSNPQCKFLWQPQINNIDDKRKMTNRAFLDIAQRSLRNTFEDVTNDYPLALNTIKNVFIDFIKEKQEQLRFKTPKFMGIDEIKIKGLGEVTVITDLEHHTLFDMMLGRNQKQLMEYFDKLPNKEDVYWVCTDMYRPFEKSIREKLPNARWVIDHFHVVGYANKALDYVRIKIQRSLSKRERIKTKKGLAYSLRTRRKDLTPEDAEKIRELRSLPKRLPMAIAYDLKEEFFEIYDNNMISKDNAIQAYKDWLKKIPPAPSPNEIDEKTQKPKPDLYKGFRELGKTVINFYDQIFNYWDCPLAISNGFTECSNRLIRERNLRGRGYSFEVLRARSLYRSANLDLMLKSNMVQFGPPIQQTADIITAETDSQVSGLTDNEDLESEEYEDNVLDTIDFYYND